MTLKVLILLRLDRLLLCGIRNVIYHIPSCKNDRLRFVLGTEILGVLLPKHHSSKTISTFLVFVAPSSFSSAPSPFPALIL